MPLDQALAVGDDFAIYGSTGEANGSVCHGCDKKLEEADTSLNTRGRCLCYSFCSRECQVVGWNTKGHKATCKLLKNRELKSLLTLDWDSFLQ